MAIDEEKLLAWLKARASERSSIHGLVIVAVYLGLVSRIERGDFDKGKRTAE